ncbi:MAG TPA: hypothetical protein PLV42_04540 [bacterium]|nr:hypothetical protein [bacterium]
MRTMLFFALLCVAANAADAADIYVNGVKADGMTAQEFKDCTVKFDDKGVVHITAPGVKILSEGAASTEPAPKLTAAYFVALNLPKPAVGPIKILVNGTDADIVKPGEKTKITEITKFLRKGPNKVLFMAGPEKNAVPIQILIGTGKNSDGSLELTPSVDKQVQLADNGLSEAFDLTAQ